MKKILSVIFVFVLSAALLLGCAPQQASVPAVAPAAALEEAAGGVLCLKINPEIAIHYDANGIVTKVEGRNQDGVRILQDFTGYEGQETSQVLTALVELIGQSGYFVEEADGEPRQITLELDPGSQVPHDRFLEDMAAHVKHSVENSNWIGQTEYDYEPTQAAESVISATEPAAPATESTVPTSKPAATTSKPAVSVNTSTLCPICGDDDCDDGAYCDDAHEKAENLRENELENDGILCPVCGDDDCDDGAYCDDAHEKAENLRENELENDGILCPVCGDDDCDDGAYCDDADEKAENLRENELENDGILCPVCGDDDCDDGAYCDDWDDKYDDDDD